LGKPPTGGQPQPRIRQVERQFLQKDDEKEARKIEPETTNEGQEDRGPEPEEQGQEELGDGHKSSTGSRRL
jgi:hypothetical protein